MRILLSLDQIRLGNLVDGLKTCRVAIADAKENLTDSDRSLALGLYVETIGSSIAHQTDEAAVAYDQLKGLVESYRPYEKLWSGRESLAEAFTLSTKGDRSGSAVADSKARELLEAALGPRSSELTLSRLLSQADQKSRGKAR